MGFHRILSLLCLLLSLHSSLPFASPLCPPDQRDALLLFKDSFVLDRTASYLVCRSSPASRPRTNSWDKGVDCCSWDGVACDRVTGNVIGLYLSCSWLRGALQSNSSLFLLPHLQRLFLLGNEFTGAIEFDTFATFRNLRELSITQEINQTYDRLNYTFPKLEVLRLSYCNLTKFPYFLNSLNRLTHLDLSSNRIRGEIPRWFPGISQDTLEELDLSENLLEGGIQQLHGKQLSFIDLHNNLFQGPLSIPPPSSSNFNASDNGFTNEIPSSICQLSSLSYLDLSNNNFSGNVPACFGNLTNLEELYLSSNKFQGPLPRSLIKCTTLFFLYLDHNEFSDTFPHWLEAPHLLVLQLQSNKFHGRINITNFGLSFPALDSLSISNNKFTGQWSTEIFLNISLFDIDLSNNQFGGPIPLPSPVTRYYSIASNNMTRKIPSSICNATDLMIINLSDNGLTGGLPWCLTNFNTSLLVLNLRMNHIQEKIPRPVSSKNKLMTLDLSRNWFEGTLPQPLAGCEFLEVLDLGDNRIEDTFPGWLGALPYLKVLILRSNNFKGHLNISNEALLFPELHILDLSNNDFGGPLPDNLIMNLKGMMNRENGQDKPLYMSWSTPLVSYNDSTMVTMKGQEIRLVKILTIFTSIDLSCNSFQGDIPRIIGHLHSLIGINLSHNHLTGSIPTTLGNLTDLEWLDLSSNKLSGGIPRNLGDLAYLGYLNLSKNKLTGRVPQNKQLSTFSSDSFSANLGLCGTPLPKACPNDAQPPSSSPSSTFERHETWFKQKVVWIGYVSGIVIGVSIAYISFETGRPKWLARGVRVLESRVVEWVEKPKRKVIKFHG